MKRFRVFIYLSVALIFCLSFNNCFFSVTKAYRFNRTANLVFVRSPSKAHLYDGSLIVFAQGFELNENFIVGEGFRYDLLRQDSVRVGGVDFDSVAFIEYYSKDVQAGPLMASIGAPILFFSAMQNEDIAKALFGSCPTVYLYDGENYSLQAECFSYSISPTFETGDLDRIESDYASLNQCVLAVKNEALETHYINQMKLLVVNHSEDYEAFPTNDHKIMLLGKMQDLLSATDKAGCDVTDLISARDYLCYRTDSTIVQQLAQNVTEDWIEAEVSIPEGAKKMRVALRFRNTLLNTVLLYDVMLQSRTAEAIDWLGVKTDNLWYAHRLYDWYLKYFGLKIEVREGEKLVARTHLMDTGPIAWHQVAAELPLPEGDVATLRFSFLPDNLMIDWIGISFDVADDFCAYEIECKKVTDAAGKELETIPSLINRQDDRYLITYPAESYYLAFDLGDEPEGIKRTCFLKSEGFYIEWIRHNWLFSLKNSADNVEFELNEATLVRTAELWLAKKPDFENQFFQSKISQQGGRN